MTMPNFFWIGPQKSASTWAYMCFKEHPDIYVHEDENLSGIGGDALHYFDMHYDKGPEWYQQFFENYHGERAIGDTTPSYIRSPKAPQRISQDVTDPKIITCLRNPINRAYSHYWHEKRKKKISFDFKEVLENYDLYQNWIEPGFYYDHIKRYYKYFDKEQILIMLMDDLKENDKKFISEIFTFLDVDPKFEPSVLDEKVNTAGGVRNVKLKSYSKVATLISNLGIKKYLSKLKKSKVKKNIENIVEDKSEYERGIDPRLREELEKIISPEVKKLENLIDRDLSHWLESTNNT